MKASSIQLLLNKPGRYHRQAIWKLLRHADDFVCLVAFAKMSAVRDLVAPLRQALKRGMTARVGVGLDFCLTQPQALRALLALAEEEGLRLYLSAPGPTFHPKIYAFQGAKGSSVIVGSANLTAGGLNDNHEASVLTADTSGILMAAVADYFDELVKKRSLVEADNEKINDYEKKFVLYEVIRKAAAKQAKEATSKTWTRVAVLAEILRLMRADSSESGYENQYAVRIAKRRAAAKLLKSFGAGRIRKRSEFLDLFVKTVERFNSGGLQRGKGSIAVHAKAFAAALVEAQKGRTLSVEEAFAALQEHFRDIPRAGINLLTEILCTLDNRRFAVMNQNAVSGLAMAGIKGYPIHPKKGSVSAERYARYCQDADRVRLELGLPDFTALDALFNYAYWD